MAEAAANGGEATYTWTNFRPGTYLYQSGSHAAVQVQMGLFGGVKKEAVAGQSYTGIPHDYEAILLLSEIDPALHAAVATGNYGDGKPVVSTFGYQPKYFLVNESAPYSATSLALDAGSVGQPTLLRLLNAGLQSRAPLLQGGHLRLVFDISGIS